MQTHRTISWLSRVANKVFECEKGQQKAFNDQQKPVIVAFLSDGTFGHSKGYAPAPKKKVAKVVATEALTAMLYEFYTHQDSVLVALLSLWTTLPLQLLLNEDSGVMKRLVETVRVAWSAH